MLVADHRFGSVDLWFCRAESRVKTTSNKVNEARHYV